MKKTYSKILKINKKGKGNVYDFTVQNTHRILANNFYTSNCSINHPDAEDFIDAKLVAGKVTGANVSVKLTDEFMKAVKSDSDYYQTFPINYDISSYTDRSNLKYGVIEEHSFHNIVNDTFEKVQVKKIKAKDLWEKIIHNAWKSAEPGLMFWDTIEREAIPDCYKEFGFKTVSTNPCIVGDTLIAVADGRNYVSIKQLAEENKDIPVYSSDDNGNLVIKTMRNPRITGYNKQIYKITIEGGHTIRVTDNHKFILKSGIDKEAKDLKYGDSLQILNKVNYFAKNNSNSYYSLSSNGKGYKEHHHIAEYNIGRKLFENEVVHHIDYIGKNNNPNNLEVMTKKEHDTLHIKDMLSDKNPYHKMTDDWKFNFASHPGETNPNFSGLSNNDIKNHAILLTKKLNRRFSKKDWIDYAKENNLPQYFSSFRLFDTIISLSKLVASELDIKFIHDDPRLVKSYNNALDNGYNAEIKDNMVIVEKICENCEESFWVDYQKREISFCSHKCALKYINNNKEIDIKRSNSLNNTYNKKGEITKETQLKIYSDLKFELGRTPLLKEWENECKNNNVPFRLKTKYGFNSFKKIKESSDFYNHKVISIELDGFEDVYNGTVDDTHKFYAGGFEEKTKSGKSKTISVLQENCGEIPLNPYDSCRLLAINLYSYVDNPFTKDAKFNFKLFKEHTQYAQRFMDDIVDLEIEKIDEILKKIDADPEPEEMKIVERNLWIKIKEKAIQGRRTGLGITSEGDMLAALGIIYGTPEATEFAEKIHKTLTIEAYKSTIIMAEERGAFLVWDFEKEYNNPFIQRIMGELDEDFLHRYKIKGRRNIALLTIAPTGSVSIMTQTTSGIEPVYLVSYKRKRKINPNDKNASIDYTDSEGIAWERYNVFHPKFKIWADINGYDSTKLEKLTSEELDVIIKKSPYYKATSNDVDWVEKVKMQGAIQKWVDHSISVTVNLPNDVTEDIVSKVYQTGWEYGCKGITVYRDGSRDGVLETNKPEQKVNIFREINAPRRPKNLKCEVIRFNNKGEKWIGFLGLLENKPYEVFSGLLEAVNIPNYVDYGEIVKIKKEEGEINSRYDFKYIDKDGYTQTFNGLSRAFNREYWNVGRMISGILRHGMPLPNVMRIIDKLDFGENSNDITSWKAGIKRMLKKYIKDGTSVHGSKCPQCGNTELMFKEGCVSCECGWSKCD